APQLVPRVLATVPGISYIADQGRPHPSEVVAFWPALVSRAAVRPHVIMGDEEFDAAFPRPTGERGASDDESGTIATPSFPVDGRTVRVPLSRLCLARSGDKGDIANIGVIARSEAIYGWMLKYLTGAFVKQLFGDVCQGH